MFNERVTVAIIKDVENMRRHFSLTHVTKTGFVNELGGEELQWLPFKNGGLSPFFGIDGNKYYVASKENPDLFKQLMMETANYNRMMDREDERRGQEGRQ